MPVAFVIAGVAFSQNVTGLEGENLPSLQLSAKLYAAVPGDSSGGPRMAYQVPEPGEVLFIFQRLIFQLKSLLDSSIFDFNGAMRPSHIQTERHCEQGDHTGLGFPFTHLQGKQTVSSNYIFFSTESKIAKRFPPPKRTPAPVSAMRPCV